MKKSRRYPSLLELLYQGRKAAVVGGGALFLAGPGCLPVSGATDGKVPLDVPYGEVTDSELPDAVSPDPGFPELGGVAPLDIPDVPLPNDPGSFSDGLPPLDVPEDVTQDPGTEVSEDLPLAGGMPLPEPTEADVPPEVTAEQDLPLAGGLPMPEPTGDDVPQVPPQR